MHGLRFTTTLCAGMLLCAPAASLLGQSVLDRPPNLSGAWVADPGTVQFNFLHRFMRSPAPLRKISNFPTFMLAAGLPARSLVGVTYATNSTLVPLYPNEWEFFGRVRPVGQDRGAPLDVGAQVGYNLAVRGWDGELSIARRQGPVRMIGVLRVLKDPAGSSMADIAVGGGAVLRVTRHLALAGDIVTLTDRDPARGERVAWSAGLQIGIPSTPHSFSLQATNTNTATLEGASRGASQVRYGFEFTIPFTLARYFGRGHPPAQPATAAAIVSGTAVQAPMRGLAYQPALLRIAVGTTITWNNQDPVNHTVTADDVGFDSGVIISDASWSYRFDRTGSFAFHCTLHPFMKGTVVVE